MIPAPFSFYLGLRQHPRVTSTFRRIGYPILMSLALVSCDPAAPEIRVFRHNRALVVDTPWTVWRWIGVEHPSLCIRHIQIFDPKQVVWRLDTWNGDAGPCVDVRLPIRLGVSFDGFGEAAPLHLVAGKTYGVFLDDVNEVDFVPFSNRNPTNITDYKKFFEAPCDSRLGKYSKHCQ